MSITHKNKAIVKFWRVLHYFCVRWFYELGFYQGIKRDYAFQMDPYTKNMQFIAILCHLCLANHVNTNNIFYDSNYCYIAINSGSENQLKSALTAAAWTCTWSRQFYVSSSHGYNLKKGNKNLYWHRKGIELVCLKILHSFLYHTQFNEFGCQKWDSKFRLNIL